jgi:DNA-binding response OmpR family regulator
MYRLHERQRAQDHQVRRILVVDDEPTLRLGFAYALTTEATTADTASNGVEALEQLERKDYDALLLDLRMPELDGLSVIERMREEGNTTPVILCSAFMTLRTTLEAIRCQVVDFLIKPVKPSDLREVIAAVFSTDTSPLGRALDAARGGRLEEAVRLLEATGPEAGSIPATWLEVLRPLAAGRPDLEALEAALPSNLLERLAFHGIGTP